MKMFNAGGTVNDDDPFGSGDDIVGEVTGQESSLSNWVGDYVTDMLGKTWGLSEIGYDAFDGPLTAGPSELQQGAWGVDGIQGVTAPENTFDANNYGMQRFTDAGIASSYMNPFIQQALNPQLDELRRQSEIQRNMDAGRLTRAGAFGGSRQAIMDSERIDNTARLMNETVGQGYRDAYNTAADIFARDEDRQLNVNRLNEESAQFAARQDESDFENTLRLLELQDAMGATQRDITQQGIDADREQFEEERDFPFKMLQFQQSMLQGLPLEAQNYSFAGPSGLGQLFGASAGVTELIDLLSGIFGEGGGGGGGGEGGNGG